MLPTDGKATNGFENRIRWSFSNPLGNFFIVDSLFHLNRELTLMNANIFHSR